MDAPTGSRSSGQPSFPSRMLLSRRAFHALAWIFAASIVAQVFIAGLAIFSHPARWEWHRTFAFGVALLPVLMLALAFLGRMPDRPRWLTVIAFVLLNVQGATAHARGVVGALHPVNALLLFWLALVLTRASAPAADRV